MAAETMLVHVGYTEQDDPHHCLNEKCGDELGDDHVVLFTTRHVRRFCSVDCVTAAHDSYWAGILRDAI